MEIRKVFKSGNSYVLSLPKEVVGIYGIKAGDYLEFIVKEGSVLIKPYKKQTRAGIIQKVAGCLKGRDQLYKELLHIRDEETDREDTTLE